jgi:predicted metal-dependent hydrolase
MISPAGSSVARAERRLVPRKLAALTSILETNRGIPVLTVRKPRFDFTDSVPHWGDNVEAVTIFNSGAIIPTPIERYLIRVMRMAKQQLDPVTDSELIETIDLFNKQEGQHHKLHNDLMAMLTAKGYPRLREFEAAFDADLKEFLATKSLAWNLAYCEGFESTGCALAEAWIDGGIKEICGDHGSIPMQLWMWHMAEEFEHRSVVHDVLHRIYGTEEAFELRKQGAAINRQHNAEHALAAAVYITEIDQAHMTSREVEQSNARALEAAMAVAELSATEFQWVFDPDYDPASISPPRNYERVIEDYPRGDAS